MAELIGEISREAQQVKRALSSGKDIFWGLRKKEHEPTFIQKVTLMGFSTLTPEQFEDTGILKNPQKMIAVDALEQYMVALNDLIDFKGAGREDLADTISSLNGLVSYRRMEMYRSFAALPNPESKYVTRSAETAISEVEFVESWIREKQDVGNFSFTDVNTYRSTVNAICEVTGAAIIFGKEILGERVKPITGQLSIQAIVDKYAWVCGRQPGNDIERAIMIAHNMGEAMQIIDDKVGIDIDQQLRVPTYMIAALRATVGNKRLAKALLESKEEEYKEKALELGGGKITGEALYRFYSACQSVLNWLAVSGRKNSLARRIFTRFRTGIREKAYMTKKI